MASVTPRVNPDATVTLYGALATHAGVRRPVTVDDPRVACDILVRDDGSRFAVIASHDDEEVTVKPARLGERRDRGAEPRWRDDRGRVTLPFGRQGLQDHRELGVTPSGDNPHVRFGYSGPTPAD